MRTYKAIQILRDLSPSELDDFASLFSNKQSIISDKNQFICVALNPDCYLLNEAKIGQLFSEDYFRPLIITNYKLLSLLLITARKEEFLFTDFSFKEDGDEHENDKRIVKEMLSESNDVLDISSFLKENSQKIRYIELSIENRKNRMRIYSNGNISLTNSFDERLNKLVLSVVQFLFTGRLS